MKQCKVYSSEKQNETAGIIVEGRVLLPASRHNNIEPAYIVDGQCYYPPFYAVEFAKNLHFDLMPFSTECEWGEYADIDSPMYNWMKYHSGVDYSVKFGYCDTKTGRIRIPPEMEYCTDFNSFGAAIFGETVKDDAYWIENGMSREMVEEWKRIRDGVYSGLIDTKGEIITGDGYVGIKKSHHGVFFVFQIADGWGAVDSEGYPLIDPLWDDISWDGLGGFTVFNYEREDGRYTYGIINSDESFCISDGFTEEPTIIYDFPPEKRRENLSLDEHFHTERFRLTQRNDKYGLIRDILENQYEPLETYSEEVLEPIYDYGELPDAAYNAWVEAEIRYYAKVIDRTPRILPGRVGDGWDAVPEDIREAVRDYMLNNGLEQPETIDDI